MSTPMSAVQTVAQLTLWRVPFKQVAGWETRNRNSHGGWGDVHGFVVHHTGDDAPDNVDLNVIVKGRSDLPGPLAQFGCDDNGLIYLIGHGRANHAGGGDPTVLHAVATEHYGDAPPAPKQHTGSAGAVDGNAHFYGVETFYSGAVAPTSRAYGSLVLLAAAVCDFHGWSAKSVIGHKEWSDWKSDPGHVSMPRFRGDVADALKAGPAKTPPDPQLVEQTKVSEARAHLRAGVKLLDAAVDNGRTGVVKEVRDVVRQQVRRLPDR